MDIKKEDRIILTNGEEATVLHVFQNYDNVRIRFISDDIPATIKKKDIKSIIKEEDL